MTGVGTLLSRLPRQRPLSWLTDRLLRGAQALCRDKRGSTSTLAAVALPTLVFAGAAGTQYAVLVMTKERLQTIADSAALGAAKQLNLTNPDINSAAAGAVAIARAQLTGGKGVVDTVNASLVDSNSGIDVTIVRTVPSLFGSLLNPLS